MGVGRTKKAPPAAVPKVFKYDRIFQERKWDGFVKAAGLERLSLDRYYVGNDWENMTYVEYEKLFTDLLADMSVAGAVVLPSQYVPEDFTFVACSTRKSTRVEVDAKVILRGGTKVILRGDTKMHSTFRGTPHRTRSYAMSGRATKKLLRRLVEGVYVALSHIDPVVLESSDGARRRYFGGVLHRDRSEERRVG